MAASEATTAYERALELTLDEDYDGALTSYNTAIQLNSANAKYFEGRALVHTKLKNWMEVVEDCEAALKLAPNNHKAYHYKGLALFSLEEYSQSVTAFDEAIRLGNTQSGQWRRKAAAEASREQSSGTSGYSSSLPTTGATSAPAVAAPSRVDAPTPAAPQMPPPTVLPASGEPTLATKVRESWYQNANNVFITLFAKNLRSQDVQVAFTPNTVTATLQMPDKSEFKKEWKLFGSIAESESKSEHNPFKVEITLKKATVEEWKSLTDDKKVVDVIKRENVVVDKAPSYPTSSRTGEKNWDQMGQQQKKEEEEEKQDGSQALHKLFQSIYAGGDEDTRRAMIKSYQTSGGTVLSTNWKEVAKKEYEKELQAPAGQEFRKWNE